MSVHRQCRVLSFRIYGCHVLISGIQKCCEEPEREKERERLKDDKVSLLPLKCELFIFINTVAHNVYTEEKTRVLRPRRSTSFFGFPNDELYTSDWP
jgi:hypothetical protein